MLTYDIRLYARRMSNFPPIINNFCFFLKKAAKHQSGKIDFDMKVRPLQRRVSFPNRFYPLAFIDVY